MLKANILKDFFYIVILGSIVTLSFAIIIAVAFPA